MHHDNLRSSADSPLSRLRIARGLTQAQLAEKIGCTGKDISRWEHGVRRPSTPSLLKLSAALECSIEELLEFSKKRL